MAVTIRDVDDGGEMLAEKERECKRLIMMMLIACIQRYSPLLSRLTVLACDSA